jgi:hypothetical protein
MRTQIATNPTACVHFKIKLVTDHTHAEIAETAPVGTYFAGTVISWKLVLACYISASLEHKDLNQGSLGKTYTWMQKSLNSSVY